MKKSRFSEQQIINILKQADAGVKVQDLCRQHGISDATYYKWKSKYGGMEASDIKRLREMDSGFSDLCTCPVELILCVGFGKFDTDLIKPFLVSCIQCGRAENDAD